MNEKTSIRKRIIRKQASSVMFYYNSYNNAKVCIKTFIIAVLSQIGLKKHKDYIVYNNYLIIRHLKGTVGQITVMLREAFPVFNYYWETPRILVWF